MPINQGTANRFKKFKKIVWQHFESRGRSVRDLPWRATRDPYKIWISEIMLQQTQVDRVRTKYKNWLVRFPTIQALAAAPVADVLREWQGLGYNRRALAAKRAAKIICSEIDSKNGDTSDQAGKFPDNYEKILALPGIGPYTAGAITAFAFNKPVPIIETNIRTVFIHHFFDFAGEKKVSDKRVSDADILPLIEKTLDQKRPREWYWALMDYGTFLKKEIGNASRRSAHYTRQKPFAGSNRQLRGGVLKTLAEKPIAVGEIQNKLIKIGVDASPEKIETVLAALASEGFIKIKNSGKKLSLA